MKIQLASSKKIEFWANDSHIVRKPIGECTKPLKILKIRNQHLFLMTSEIDSLIDS